MSRSVKACRTPGPGLFDPRAPVAAPRFGSTPALAGASSYESSARSESSRAQALVNPGARHARTTREREASAQADAEGLIGGRRFGLGKRQRWCAACGKGPSGSGETRPSRRADGTVRGSRALRTAVDESRSRGRQRDTEASVEGFRGLAPRLNRPTRASTEPQKHGPPYRMKHAGRGTREPATARGDGTNRPAIRGRGSPHRKVWVSRRRSDSFDPRLARGSVQHFAARTSVRPPRGARGAADRRV